MSRLAFDDVACVRGGRMLFTHVHFDLGAGAAMLVGGRNGVGKSSLIRVAGGLLDAFAGTVTRDGAAVLADEGLALDREKPLAAALGFWARIDGVGDVMPALAAVDLAHLAEVPVRMLSTGQRKRAVLARVVLSGAPIWLLDEPANGLDTASVALLGTLIAAHRAKGGIILAASHLPLPIEGATMLDLDACD